MLSSNHVPKLPIDFSLLHHAPDSFEITPRAVRMFALHRPGQLPPSIGIDASYLHLPQPKENQHHPYHQVVHTRAYESTP